MIANREKRLARLRSLQLAGEVDRDVIEILEMINFHSHYLTTSSCSGRIQLIELREVGDKKSSNVVAKWHRPPTPDDFISSVSSWKGQGLLYLMMQSPIFHVETETLPQAIALRNLGQANGFKYSTIRSVKLDRLTGEQVKVIVELLASECIHAPLGENGIVKADRNYLDFLYERAFHQLLRAKRKLAELKKGLGTL